MTSFKIAATEARKIAKTVAVAMSKDATRYYLNGVCLDAGSEGIIAVATDGHRLASLPLHPLTVEEDKLVPDTLERNFKVILPVEAVEWMGKLPRKVTSLHTVTFDILDAKVTLSFWEWDRLQSQAHFQLIEGNFPEWRRVMPAICKKMAVIQFNAKYLMELCKAVIENTEKADAFVQLRFVKADSPARLEDKHGLTMVLMPVRL